MQKNVSFKVKGMQRDLSVSAFNSEYAYENKNVRIMPTNESTLLSLINERGNKESNIVGIGDYIQGIPIGQSLINNELVVFTAVDDSILDTNIVAEELSIDDITADEKVVNLDYPYEDRIYKIWFNNNILTGQILFKGNLGFNYKYPIETIPFYENSDIRKVYWTDGLNQPRVINIAAGSSIMNKWKADSFNFVRTLNLNESVTITRNIVANGNFAPGVIQYAFTYFNKYSQESNIFYTSPLYYISYNNRGASPEDKVSNSFNIVVENVDTGFDYLRIYSIHRTSIDAVPTVKRVVDLSPVTGSTSYEEYEYITTSRDTEITLHLREGLQKENTLDTYTPEYSSGSFKKWVFDTNKYYKLSFDNGNDVILNTDGTLRVVVQGDVVYLSVTGKPFIFNDLYRKKIVYTDNGLSGDSILFI